MEESALSTHLGGGVSNMHIESTVLRIQYIQKTENVLWENKGERNNFD